MTHVIAMSQEPQNLLTEWCAGLPLTAQRSLSDAEREALRAESGRLRRSGCLSLPLVPVCFLAMLLALAVSDSAERPGAAFLAATLLMLTAVALLANYVRDCLRRGRLLRGDLREGYVKHFEGVLDESVLSWTIILSGGRIVHPRGPGPPLDPTLALLLRLGLMRPDTTETQWVEALPVSGRVWRVNGQKPRAWITAVWSEVAETPGYAAAASAWLVPVSRSPEGTVSAGQRALSPSESEELRRRIRDAWRRPLLPALLLSLWFFPLLAGFLWERRLPPDWHRLSFLLLGFAALSADGVLLLSLQQASRLRRDLETGVVSVVRVTNLASGSVEQDFEVLPTSRLVWTEAGRPAAWRKRPI
jgi:hypothetical protein